MPWPLGHTVWSFSTKPAGTPRVSSRFRKTSPCCRCRPHVRSSMQQRTSGNTCARPISPTVYSRATPTFLMPVRPPGASFSTKPAASPPSQRATGQSSVNHNEGWYKLKVPKNLTLLPLPPACPELNAAENIWQYLRQTYLANRVFKSYTDILDACQTAWRKLLDETGRITSIATRDWAIIGQS